ncbi:hypothetical protein SBOR_0187 [Sclerotinia borealis F-4128]|uniref:Mitochondrial import inner membrane translocase subunit TIM50 n=1 Tax=Sclerotinia borealis (strain F-4128) TaxID=1432307 RepID=W9CXS9_SCLBF|nr:hypothetical protein SBOR_0187 [Sclerotinia borealis F-4128]
MYLTHSSTFTTARRLGYIIARNFSSTDNALKIPKKPGRRSPNKHRGRWTPSLDHLAIDGIGANISKPLHPLLITPNLAPISDPSHKSKYSYLSLASHEGQAPARKTMVPLSRFERVQPSEASGGIPNPTKEYLDKAYTMPGRTPVPSPHARHLLVVIDLNGTLLYRPNRKHPTKFTARPHAEKFLQYCIDTFSVIIWSSAKAQNVIPMCQTILTPDLRQKIVAIWGRETFGLSLPDYKARVQCYKRLTRLWDDPDIAATHPNAHNGGQWDQTNTVLIDDSSEKARSEPFNLIEIPEFFGDHKEVGDVLPQVHDYLNFLSMHENVSAAVRHSPFVPQPKASPRVATDVSLPIHPPRAPTPVKAPAPVVEPRKPAHSSDNVP